MKRHDRSTSPGPDGASKPGPSPRRAGWLLALPLFALLGTLSARVFHESRSPTAPGRAPDRLGRLSRGQAVALANSLCARLTGAACRPLDVSARATPAGPTAPPLREWDVLCQARTGSCSLQIDADTKELLVFQRDAGHTAASLPASGGERCALTRSEMERYARHYLARAGLSLPTGAQHLPSPGTAVVYECAGISGGRSRLLQVRVNRTDASLEFLLNRPFQSSRRLNRGQRTVVQPRAVRAPVNPFRRRRPARGSGA